MRCFLCRGPAHEATGWVLSPNRMSILCGRCARDFARWYKGRQGRMGHPRHGENETFQEAMSKSIIGEAMNKKEDL